MQKRQEKRTKEKMIEKMIGIRQEGMMSCTEVKRGDASAFLPKISPNIQGAKAYKLLTDEQKGMLKYALQNAGKKLNCSVSDLEWSFGRGNPVQPLMIRKKQRIEI